MTGPAHSQTTASATEGLRADGYEPVGGAGFGGHLGPVLRRRAGTEGTDHFILEPKDHHLNDGGQIHEGVLTAFAGIILNAAVADAVDGAKANTVSLNCDFVSPADSGKSIEGRVRIDRRARTVVFASAEIYAAGGNGETTLLTASGVWKLSAG